MREGETGDCWGCGLGIGGESRVMEFGVRMAAGAYVGG